MSKPSIHLICNAHLDPVWQWRWEEGASEALSTFNTAIEMLRHHRELIFNHNEAILYMWVKKYDPSLFREIQTMVRKGRWCISGGWFLQPDANMPGLESYYRHIAAGLRFFDEHFNARPRVAYNFDSFGHCGGLPQILTQTGYRMYIHMRPQGQELPLPADLYRWQGVDGSMILTYRIAVGLYHTERDNIEQRLAEGTERALTLNRDVPVFWGIGDHGGGATREDLERIDAFIAREKRVRIVHSAPENLYRALKPFATAAPIVRGDIQRVFTGCYTSLSRLKRRAQKGLAELTQGEALRTATWLMNGQQYPAADLDEAWRDHLFNDFHDILPGSCTEPAEQDALDQYGRAAETVRRLRLGAAAALNEGPKRSLYIPVTVLNTNPAMTRVPVDVECMLDLRPKWTGTWHLRLYTLAGEEIPCQEEQPESLLPFNGWRRKVSFFADLPQLGASRYELRIHEGTREAVQAAPALNARIDPRTGLVCSIDGGGGRECLTGPMLRPLVVEDDGDSWGTDRWSYRNIVGEFKATDDTPTVLHEGQIRRTTESVLRYGSSSIVLQTTQYSGWPVIEYRLRILWNEPRKRLKLSVPTAFSSGVPICEVPGGALLRPADGQEHVHGRWCMLHGDLDGRDIALGVINSGQHGIDVLNGELRLSVLRSAAYCHEQTFALGTTPARKYMDLGTHDLRLLVTLGNTGLVRSMIGGLADWLNAPPLAYPHLPIGRSTGDDGRGSVSAIELHPCTVRVVAFKQAWDGKAAVLRLHETVGEKTTARIVVGRKKARVAFRPYEVKTFRVGNNGKIREVDPVDEGGA